MTTQYQIDAEMIGPEFKGDLGDLSEFIPILADQTGRPESDFVARQHIGQWPGAEEPSEADWNSALESFVEARPDLF